MLDSTNYYLKQSKIYQKSIEIFKLSRSIASYVTDDKDMVSMHRSGSKTDNYADNLVMNSFRLVPKVVEAEIQDSPTLKLKYAKSLRVFVDRIYQDAVALENTVFSGKDFLQLLHKEVKSFRKIHGRYLESIE